MPSLFVLQRDLPNCQLALLTDLQKFRRARKGKRRKFLFVLRSVFAFPLYKTSANGVVCLGVNPSSGRVERIELHAVGMRRERFVPLEQQIPRFLKRNSMFPCEAQLF